MLQGPGHQLPRACLGRRPERTVASASFPVPAPQPPCTPALDSAVAQSLVPVPRIRRHPRPRGTRISTVLRWLRANNTLPPCPPCATQLTRSECPLNFRTSCLVLRSQRRARVVPPQVTNCLEPGRIANPATACVMRPSSNVASRLAACFVVLAVLLLAVLLLLLLLVPLLGFHSRTVRS